MSNALTKARDEFSTLLHSETSTAKLKKLLPADVSIEVFQSVVTRALAEDPALLSTNKESLFLACSRAAQDGLLPDKREGAMVVYKGKAQWQPMVAGIRKRAAMAGFTIDAQNVFSKDYFDYQLGDQPFIDHKPAKMGTPRGKYLGTYAIATGPDGRKYRAVIEEPEMNQVRSVSRAPNGPWKDWYYKMTLKTAVKLLFKSLPINMATPEGQILQGIIDRDNEDYDLDGGRRISTKAQEIQNKVRRIQATPEELIEPEEISAGPLPPLEGELEPIEAEPDEYTGDSLPF